MDDGTEILPPPGAVGVSHLNVYESVAPDGLVAYAEASTLPEGVGSPSGDLTAAYRRRDLAVRGFLELRAGGPTALRGFYQAAARLIAPRLGEWRVRWERGALHTAQETGRQLDALAAGETDYLSAGGVRSLPAPSEHLTHGMCGLLDTYRVPAPVV